MHAGYGVCQRALGNVLSVDAETLRGVHQVGGGIKSGRLSGSLQYRSQHRCHGALTVDTGDLNHPGDIPLGPPQRGHEGFHAVQSRADTESTQAIEEGHGLGECDPGTRWGDGAGGPVDRPGSPAPRQYFFHPLRPPHLPPGSFRIAGSGSQLPSGL